MPPSPSHLTDGTAAIARQVPGDVGTARALPHSRAINTKRNRNITVVSKLSPGRKTNLASTIDHTAIDTQTVAVLDEHGIVTVAGQVGVSDSSTARLGHAEDATTTAAGDNTVDDDVVGVGSVETTVLVGEAEGGVAGACSDVLPVDETDPGVGGGLQEKTAFTHVTCNNLVDPQTVDVPRLDGMAARAVNCDGAHRDIRVGSLVTVESDTQTATQVQVDRAEVQALHTVESQAKVWATRHGEVGDRNALGVERLDSTTAAAAGDVDGAAALKDLATGNGDGVGANATRRNDGDTLAAADAIEGRLDSQAVVTARVELGGAAEGTVGA